MDLAPTLVEGDASVDDMNSVEDNVLSTSEEDVKTPLRHTAINHASQEVSTGFTEARVDAYVNDAFSKVRYDGYRFVTIRRSDTRHYYR